MKKKSKFKLNWRDCKKEGIFTLEDRIIRGKLYKDSKRYHFELCKNCKKNCNGKIQYKAERGALQALARAFK